LLEPARDYKRLLDDDRGPNTGGMGCFSPPTDLPDDLLSWTEEQVIGPVLSAMLDRGIRYRGFLYVGLMLTSQGPMVLEFNCRLGDPETQAVLPRMESDLLALLSGAVGGTMPTSIEWSPRCAVDVVLASEGYPESPATGREITGADVLEDRDDVLVFHAGTRRDGETLVTSGGRVLNVVGLADDQSTARGIAYEAAEAIVFEGKQFRLDIAR
jgi:phosphoribosylamine--glycine ligase